MNPERPPINRSLIIAPSWIGDAVMTQPLLFLLKAQNPDRVLDVFAPPWVAPVFSRMKEVAHIIENPFNHGETALKKRLSLAKSLKNRYQYAYVLPNSLKSALIPFFARIPKRIGFTGEMRFGLINCRHTLNKTAYPLMVERFARLSQAHGAPDTGFKPPLPYPCLISSPAQKEASLTALGLEKPDRPLAVFCPGAEYGPAKRWPPEHFAALAKELIVKGWAVWLLGSGKDKPIAQGIIETLLQSPGGFPQNACRNLCGETRITEAIDLIALSSLVVCNDSGLMHVAAALNRPLVALFGSSSPKFTPPLSQKSAILSLNLPCSPCFKRTCPFNHLDCLAKLTPTDVLASALELFDASRAAS